MAIIKGAIQMTGSIKGVSFYTVRGSDRVIMRTKGGASKNQMATSPKFEGVRRQQKEWGGCAKFGSIARYAFGGLHRLADYNLTPVLNGMGKNLMKLDTESETGSRSLKLSTYRQALEGFSFNRNYTLNSVLRVYPVSQIDRKTLSGTVTLPRINAEIDLLNFRNLPYFRIIVALGSVSDLVFDADKNQYAEVVRDLHGTSTVVTGEWNSTQSILDEQQITVTMPESQRQYLTDDVTLLLSLAVEFGTVGFTGQPVEVKYAGCGKVIKVC
jgi:hypothetical protein